MTDDASGLVPLPDGNIRFYILHRHPEDDAARMAREILMLRPRIAADQERIRALEELEAALRKEVAAWLDDSIRSGEHAKRAEAECERLRHDIDRAVQRNTDMLAECERLREELAARKGEKV